MDTPNPAIPRTPTRRSLAAADKSVHECRCIGSSVLDVFFVKQHTIRLQREAGSHRRFDAIRRGDPCSHPARIRGVQPLLPEALRDILKFRKWIPAEVEYDDYLIHPIPPAHDKHTIFLKADDIHFVLTQ